MENQYGVDIQYTKEWLERIMRGLHSYRPEELRRELIRLANTMKTGDNDEIV